jgi:hypothetical protein
MKIKLFRFFPVVWLTFLLAQPVSAHGSDPRIEINTDRLNPGSVLDIRGVDFEFEEAVELALVGIQTQVPFGAVLADVEGVFLLSITLPLDLPEGMYVIRATTDDHMVESPQIVVLGSAIIEGGGQGERDEDDGLLAPMPTYAPGVSSTPIPQAAAVESEPARASSSPPLFGAIAAIGIILVFAFIRIKKR